MPASNNNVLVKQLIEFGLSEKEAKVYLALLELEVATVNEAAETADINRSSAYVVMEALKRKGLVSTSEHKKIQTYSAVSPEMLLREAKDRVIKTNEIESKISNIIPELKALHKDTKHKPRVRVFEGINGVRDAYWDVLSTKTDKLRTYANPINIFKYIPDFQKQDLKRAEQGIKMYAVNPATREMIEFTKHAQPSHPFELVLIPENKYNFSSDIGIYADRFTIISPQEKFGIIIESKRISDIMKNIFDMAYEEAKRLSKYKYSSKTKSK